MILRICTIICDARRRVRRKTPKHDDYHINSAKILAAIAAQIRDRHGLTRLQRKYASPEFSALHRFASA
jgi:hypothetical protein